MKIVCISETLDSYDNSTSSITTRIVEVDAPLDKVVEMAREEILDQIRYTMDSEDENDLNDVVDELNPKFPTKDRLWGQLLDPDFDLRFTVTIVQ